MKKRAKKKSQIARVGIALTDGEKPVLPGTPEYDDAMKLVIKHLPAQAAAIIRQSEEDSN